MNEYATHLANMQEKKSITASEDIFSDNGVLLAKGGTKINRKICDNLLKFKLLKPLENSIAIENQLNSKSFYNLINQMVNNDNWIKSIDNKITQKSILQKCCIKLDKFPILEQKLTVLQMELADVFNKSLLSAYLTYACGIIKKTSPEEIQENFLAALIKDIGFLHIDQAILKKTEKLTAEEWRTIQSHPVIIFEMARQIPGISKSVARGLLEHHENLDGSGYPRGKTKEDLGQLGQFLSLLDNLIAIYEKKLKPRGRSLRDATPVLQINIHSYFPEVVSIIIQTIRLADRSPPQKATPDTIKKLIENTQEKQSYISQMVEILTHTNHNTGSDHNNNEAHTVQNIANNIGIIINRAGLYDISHTTWLEDLEADNNDSLYNDIEETSVMLDEIIYQFDNYQKAATNFIHQYENDALSSSFQEGLEQVNSLEAPAKFVQAG